MTIGFPVAVLPQKPAASAGVSTLIGVNGSGGLVQISGGNLFQQGNQSPVAGSKMKIDRLLNDSANYPTANEGAIWAGTVYTNVAIATDFDASNTTSLAAPSVGVLSIVNNASGNSLLEAVAVMGNSVVRTANGVGFGANFIARDAGVAARLVGCEIDLQFSSGGSVIAGSGALYLNVFSKANAGPAILLGGLGGGTFTNGIVLDAISGAGLSPNLGSSMASLINTGIASFSQDAIVVSNTHKIRLNGTSTTHGKLYMDASDNERLVLGNGLFVIRDKTDIASLFSFTSGGVAVASTAFDATTEFRANGTKILGQRGAALPAAASDLATAITLVNALRSKFSASDGGVVHPLFA